MKRPYFILALIFISETMFRLLPYNPKANYDLFLTSDHVVNLTNYLYYFFEHLKVIGLIYILYIENTRWRWLLYLFIADLSIYLLNYSSTLTHIGGFPIGMDIVKLIIFGTIIIREALIYHNGRSTYHDEHRSFVAYAHGHVSKKIWSFPYSKRGQDTNKENQ